MIASYNKGWFLQINIYKTDLPQLHSEKTIKCISNGIKEWLITTKISPTTKREHLDLKYSKNESGYEKLEIIINKTTFKELLVGNIELLGTRGQMEHLPFDRLEIHYQNLNGTNASKHLDKLTQTPSLRKLFL